MITIGDPPYLECSSKGDIRFSAFYARPRKLHGKSIEEAYQALKIFNINGKNVSNLSWKEAKGKLAINQDECNNYYKELWKDYIIENDYIYILKGASGLSDIFGQKGHICQAEVLWEIRNNLVF